MLFGYALLSALTGCTVDSQILKSSQSSATGAKLSNLLQSSVPILVQDLPNDGVVNSSNEASYQIAGFCKFNGQEVQVSTAAETKTVTCTDNTWSTTLNLAGLGSESIPVKILTGSFVTSLGLPRKLNTTTMDLLVNWNCQGNQGCPAGNPVNTGSINGLKATNIPSLSHTHLVKLFTSQPSDIRKMRQLQMPRLSMTSQKFATPKAEFL
jgi:hypothetical protein